MNEEAAARPVLLVEDDENDIFFFQLALDSAELKCALQIVRDGREAMAYLAGEGVFADRVQFPLPRLVVLDLNLPRRPGLEVLKWIRQQPTIQDLPVIVLTSSAAESDRSTAAAFGAKEYWVKPGDPLQLSDFAERLKAGWLNDDLH